MSSEGSIVPIKLAQRFIHVIDFHADPVTCISASSGTVSYDSVTSPKYPQNDAILCGQQPPPPPHKSTIKTVFKKELMEIPIPVDIEMFRAIQKEQDARKYACIKNSKNVNGFAEAGKEVESAFKECLKNFKKPKNDPTRKAVTSVSIEFPSGISDPVHKPKDIHKVHFKAISERLSTRILEKLGYPIDGHQQCQIASKMCLNSP
ncbi:Reverse transcriptase domain-containing protein [Caenorhabditis elegans]|uniref:Reverse transcriptase domain-containing protein n=1 Tax=Caenorhabditis elegans TaxID=6239 RepID=Q9XX22_CAEEL|nr:Reverse transcriptase domain-containing protein [Caenorhabditis elegans]CAA21018.3 Reverse transcriptase domain-containing protein [Caenorhabditis elegans]|eukprot:NP_499336.3 Uncharacterized protein CELE_Y39A1A.2 [Caenorhabditis elegans]